MIVGVGVDILDTRRIAHLLEKFSEKFEKKYFTEAERLFCHSRTDYISAFAKMFSIKEAVIKCIVNKRGLTWHSIEVFHDNFGAPYVKLKNNNSIWHVSTSDEYPYVISYAVMEKRNIKHSVDDASRRCFNKFKQLSTST